MKAYARGFYNSTAWRKTQKAYMQSKNYTCERCGRTADIVHHKIHINPANINDTSITLDWNNLEALCIECHNTEHFTKSEATGAGLKFDESGNLVKE